METPAEIAVNFMSVRDGTRVKASVAANGNLYGAYCQIIHFLKDRGEEPVLLARAQFFLAKHDDGTWLSADSNEAKAMFRQRKALPPLAAMLERPQLDGDTRLMHPDLLGKSFVYDHKEIHILYIVPYESRIMRWLERLLGRPCGRYGSRSRTWEDIGVVTRRLRDLGADMTTHRHIGKDSKSKATATTRMATTSFELQCALLGDGATTHVRVYANSRVEDVQRSLKIAMPDSIPCDASHIKLQRAFAGTQWLTTESVTGASILAGKIPRSYLEKLAEPMKNGNFMAGADTWTRDPDIINILVSLPITQVTGSVRFCKGLEVLFYVIMLGLCFAALGMVVNTPCTDDCVAVYTKWGLYVMIGCAVMVIVAKLFSLWRSPVRICSINPPV